MDRLKRAALITRLLQKLREKGSWCGETHVQKAAFFLQNLMRVPLGFDFILYKHGPFSFDLRDELTSMRADGLVRLVPQWPYGPSILTTDLAKNIQDIYSKTLKQYESRITFVAEKLGGKGVAELERLATALYVTQEQDEISSSHERVKTLTTIKPHISTEQAAIAIEEIDRIIEESQRILAGSD